MSEPWLNIQWKGTDSCLDFNCSCGENYHLDIDAPTPAMLHCNKCDKFWMLPNNPTIDEATDHQREYWKGLAVELWNDKYEEDFR